MTTTTTTNNRNANEFFEVRLTIFAGSNQRVAFDKDALKSLGFAAVDFDAVKAMLQTAVLPKEAFYPFLAIRKSVQDYLATKGVNHDLMGRVFNPDERVEIVTFLKEKQEEYDLSKENFLTNYPAYISEQLEKVENSATLKGLDPKPLIEAVKSNQPSVDYYRRKLEFRFLDMSIKLDSAEWSNEIDQINADLERRTVYETTRDANKIRDIESLRGKAKAVIALSSRFKSLNFYVPGLNDLALEVDSIVTSLGGLKPSSAYSTKEGMILTGLAKVIAQQSAPLISGKTSLSIFMSSEINQIEALLAAEEAEVIMDELETLFENTNTASESPSVESPSIPKPVAPATGAFAF